MQERKIKYASHLIEEDDIEAVVKVLKSDYLTCGPVVEQYEAAFAEKVNAKYAIAVSSGTAALHLACKHSFGAGGYSVVTSPITFRATRNAILYCNEKPSFIEVDSRTLLLDPDYLTGNANILGVDYAGQPCDYDALEDYVSYPCNMVIDAAHSLGATYKGKPVGSWHTTCFSTHAIKSITTGEGGMITTRDERVMRRCKNFRDHARGCEEPGFNYRLTEMQAALGLSQLKKLDRFMEHRQHIADTYREALANVKGISCLHQHANRTSANHLFVIVCGDRDALRDALKEKGIGTQIHYPSLSNDCPVACSMAQKILSLPCHCALSDEDVDYVISSVKEAVEKCT